MNHQEAKQYRQQIMFNNEGILECLGYVLSGASI